MRRPHAPLAVTMMLVLQACTSVAGGSTAAVDAPNNTVAMVLAEPEALAETASFESLPDHASLIVRPASGHIEVYDQPDGNVMMSLPQKDGFGTSTTLAAVSRPIAGWVEVQLAIRPNFTNGWVREADVAITWTTLRIVIDLADHRLTLYDDETVLTWGTVAIGTPSTPTPRGTTYVTELLTTPQPESLYGPFAMGLALFSDRVTEYAGGNGQIGIHGTNRSELLGGAASLGCVRTHNDLIAELAGRVPLGTPVEII